MQLITEHKCQDSKSICEIFHLGLVTEGVKSPADVGQLVAHLTEFSELV